MRVLVTMSIVVKISEPLVRVLHLVNGDKKPTMRYLYEAMDKAKLAIKARLNNRISLHDPYVRLIDAKWDKQLHSPLHSAVAWWEQFGNNYPDLQKFATRILSQCYIATRCERNWSTFEFIHSKI
ncbi:hypothetical protein ACSBR1_001749 [Camellia fascicularis]